MFDLIWLILTYFDFRYGLIGANGSGKSSLLAVLGNREVPIQDHIDIYYLSREMPASEKSALEAVMEVCAQCGNYIILLIQWKVGVQVVEFWVQLGLLRAKRKTCLTRDLLKSHLLTKAKLWSKGVIFDDTKLD